MRGRQREGLVPTDHSTIGDESSRHHTDVFVDVEDAVVRLLLVQPRSHAVLYGEHDAILSSQRNRGAVDVANGWMDVDMNTNTNTCGRYTRERSIEEEVGTPRSSEAVTR
jgi:hypothetical protein